MGHYVTYMDFPKNATKTQINEARAMAIENDGERECGHLLSHDSGFTLHGGKIYDSYDEAVAAIERLDNGWYDDHGVLYRDYTRLAPTKEMQALEKRLTETHAKQNEFIKNHMPNRVKAEYVGCRTCGSKIAKKYLNGVYCPVCRKDIRPQSTIDRDKAYTAKVKELEARLAEATKKQKGKAEVRWLVKLEFHV